jgi:hypothetical protein
VNGFDAQIGLQTFFPLTQMDLTYGLCDRHAKSLAAVEDADANLDICDLPIEVPRHLRLAQ